MEKWLGWPLLKYYKDLNLNDLSMNSAYVIANTTLDNIGVYVAYDNCAECPYKLVKKLQPNQEVSWPYDFSKGKSTWRVMNTAQYDYYSQNNRRGLQCQTRPELGEYGVYKLEVGKCVLNPEVPPAHTYLPFVYFATIIISLLLCYIFGKHYFDKKNKNNNQQNIIKSQEALGNKEKDNELIGIYIMRGILTYILIFLMTGAGGYSVFISGISGFNVVDIIFLGYCWTLGFCVPIHADNIYPKSKCRGLLDVLKRTTMLIAIGLMIDSIAPKNEMVKLWYPLLRIGIAYFVTAASYTLTAQKIQLKSKNKILKSMANVVTLIWCWIFAVFIVAMFCILILTFVSMNCQYNTYLEEEKGFSNIITEVTQNCNNNFTEIINKVFVAEDKSTIFANKYYGFNAGLMGILTTILVTMSGLVTGVIYSQQTSNIERLVQWTLWAFIFGTVGVATAYVSKPLDFNLWPLGTLTLVSSGSVLAYIIIYSITEMNNFDIKPISYAGFSSILIFCGHLLFSNTIPFTWGIKLHSHIMYLTQNLWILLLWSIVCFMLSKKNWKFNI